MVPFIFDRPTTGLISLGPGAALTPVVSVLTLLGCRDCGYEYGAADAFGRAYVDSTGTARFEPLLWADARKLGIDGPSNSMGLPEEGGPYSLGSVVGSRDGSDLIATICCFPHTMLYRSTDGGVTWSQYFDLGPNYTGDIWLGTWVGPGKVLLGCCLFASEPPFQVIPPLDGPTLTPPPGGGVASAPFLIDGKMVWGGENGQTLWTEDGLLYSILEDPPGHVGIGIPVFGGKAGELGAMYVSQGKEINPQTGYADGPDQYIALFDAAGEWRVTRSFYVQGLNAANPEGWIDATHILAWAPIPPDLTPGLVYDTWGSTDFALAILDIESDEIGFLQDPFLSQDLPVRSVLGLQRGPFLRVHGTDSCLNIRAEPSTDAAALECAADGVFLYDHLHGDADAAATPVDGWFEVTTPDGVHGYASAEFLEVP